MEKVWESTIMIMLNKLFVLVCVFIGGAIAFQSDDLYKSSRNLGMLPNLSVPLVYSICSALDSSEDVYWGKILFFEQRKIEYKPNYENLKRDNVFSKKTINLMLKETQSNSLLERKMTVKVEKMFDKKKKMWQPFPKDITFKDTVECGSLWVDYDFIRTYQSCREFVSSKNEERESLNRLFFLKQNKIFAFSKSAFYYVDSNVFDCTYIKDLLKKRIFAFYDANGMSQEFDKRVKHGLYFNPKQLSDYDFYHSIDAGCLATADAIWIGTIYGNGVVIDSIRKTNDCIWNGNLYSDSLESFLKENKKYTEYEIEYKVNVKFQLERPFEKLKWKRMGAKNQKKLIGRTAVGNVSCNFMIFPFYSEVKHLNDGKERLFYVNKTDDGFYLAYYSEPIVAKEVIEDKDPAACLIKEKVSNLSIIPYANNIDAMDYLW